MGFLKRSSYPIIQVYFVTESFKQLVLIYFNVEIVTDILK